MLEAIDISKHNLNAGPIDWPAVKAGGIDGVMIRAGWAGYAGELHPDPQLEACILGASAAGLNVGLYVYAYCKSPAAARKAAEETVSIAQKYVGKITYPLALDVEITGDTCLTSQGGVGLSATIAAWCDRVQELGWYASWYTYTAFAASYLDVPALVDYDLWIADYRGDRAKMEAQLCRTDYGMWQYDVLGTIGTKGRDYQTHGQVPGVPGNCDKNRVYRDYPALIRGLGLNGLKADKPTTISWAELGEELKGRGITGITI